MGAAALIAELQARGFVLSLLGDGRLRCEGPEGLALTETERTAIREQRASIVAALSLPEDSLPRAPRDGRLPLSSQQRRLWTQERLAGDGPPAYHIPTLLRLRGLLDLTALRAALDQLVARHEILRTAIHADDGEPWQEVLPPAPLALPVEDRAAAEIAARVKALALEPFDLAAGQPLRTRLFHSGPSDHTLLLLQHHIVSDGWSVERLVLELGRLYEAALAGTAPPPPPIRHYADFAAWQAAREGEANLKATLEHWTGRLAGAPLPELPTDHARPAALGSRGGHLHRTIPAAVAEGLRVLAASRRTTLFAVTLAAFKLLLWRLTGQSDLVVTTPVANRPHEDLAGMPGFFVNMLPLRSELAGATTAGELIDRVDETLHHALSRQELPFDRLVAALGLPRDPARQPLFQVIFALQSANRETQPPFAGLETALEIEADYDIAKAELTFSLQERPEGLALRVEWNADLFTEATAARFADWYGRLLAALATRPEARLAELPLIDGEGFRALVLRDGRNPRPYPRDESIPRLFARQVAARPEATAIAFDGESLTYAALAARARRLARHLEARAGGIAPGDRVALCLERSIDFVVAALACLELRAVFVPIDPASPPARIALLCDAVQARLVVLHAASAGRAPEAYTTVDLAAEAASFVQLSSAPLELPGLAEDAAYITFTSGTTGVPKGVTVSHRAIARLAMNCDYHAFRSGQRIGFASNIAFDASTFEIWGALLNGGCLIGIAQDTLLDLDRLEALIREQQLEVLWLTTALFEQIAEQRPAALAPLQSLLTGGARHSAEVMRRFLANPAGRPARVLNCYGPTENTTFSTTFAIEQVAPGQRSLPIGRPIANSTVYVLSPDGQPQPAGIAGELFVGGDGVALGYHGQPALTAERFLALTLAHPDCPGEAATDRVYRTGDYVRWLPDGTLEFIGRRDDQVKLRGFRIELAEVDAALEAVPGVQMAVSRVQDGHLVAWYVTADAALTPAALLGALAETLPPHMVPAGCLRLAALPINASGKVDLPALPPVPLAAESAGDEALNGPVEEALAAIWCSVLKLERVGRHQSFFAIGGDSILSIQVVARAREAGLTFTPRQLFEAGTLARLAQVARPLAVAPRAAGHDPHPFALTPIQAWFFALPLAHRDHFNQALLLQPARPLEAESLRRALAILQQRHEGLRLRFAQDAEGHWQQAVALDAPAPLLHRLDLAGIDNAAQAAAIEQACTAWQSGFDIAQGPLFAAGLIEGHADGRQRLFLAAHHLAVDGVSWRLLLGELARLLAGDGLPAAEPGMLRAWSEALQAYATSPATQAQVAAWSESAREARFLPAQPPPAGAAQATSLRLDRSLSRQLLAEAGRAYGTRSDELLLAALAVALARWSGKRRFGFGLEGHGREESVLPLDASAAVGWFTCLYPVALDLPAGVNPAAPDWSAFVPAVKERLRAVPDRGLGFGALRYLAREARLAALPAPEMTVNLLGSFEDAAWSLAPEGPGTMTAPEDAAPYPLDLTALVIGGALELRLTQRGGALLPASGEALLDRLRSALADLVAHCLSQPGTRRTPSDYPSAGLDQAALDRLLASLPAPPERLFGLTPLQEGLLFHARHSPDSDQYLVQFHWDLAGDLDPARLRQAWAGTLAIHEALRARFLWRGLPRPLQAIERDVLLPWQELDWQGDPEGETARFLATDRARGYDLAQPCPMRLALAKIGPARWRFVWSQHHILLDGWCLPLLLDEVARRYRGEAVAPPALRLEDYVAWLGRQDPAAAHAFWRQELAGFAATTDLSFRRAGTLLEANRGIARLASRSLALPADLDAKLNALARRQGVTLNAVLQLAWGLILARTTGQSDVVHGTTVSGRSQDLPGLERMVGLAINSLPVRQKLDDAATVAEALQAVNRRMQEINHWSTLPLTEVQAASDLPPGEALFHSLLVFENYPAEGLSGGGVLRAANLKVLEKTSYPLLLMAIPGETLQLRLDYDADRFEADAMRRLEGWLLTLLASLAEDGTQGLGTLRWIPEAELAELESWQGEAAPFDRDTTLVQLIAAQTWRTPDAIAVEDEAGCLTFAELDLATNRLANVVLARHAALGRPLAADTPVGLCLERGIGLEVAILAVLKAGGAWLPLDPDYPEARLADMLEDSGATLVISDEGLKARVPLLATLAAGRLLLLEDPAIPVADASAPPVIAGPENLAYIIYTSGSTGRPKGVALEHRGLVNRLQWMQAAYPLTAADRVLQKTPYSFDVSVWEFLWPPMVGATLVFARPGGHRDPAYLARSIAEQRITTLHFVPSMLQAFAERPELPDLTGLRLIFCSGEGLPTQLTRRVLQALPDVGLHNLYGPTEATVDVSWHPCSLEDGALAVTTPIGRPVWNTTLHILDPAMRPLPVGVPGELWLGGVQLARGYLNRPELTADRFRPNPLGPGRLYKTGDLVRRRPDGIIDYLGRTDFQVKLRGVRIELGEIEAAMERHPAIRQACLLAIGSGADTSLAAYYVGPDAVEQAALRAFLGDRLPEAMLPASFTWLAAFPLTTSGKVDRNRLPKPALAARTARPAADALELSLTRILAAVLGLPGVGPEDDFFALGGHSLKATQVVSRVQAEHGVELPLRDLFQARTAAALATLVAKAHRTQSAPLALVADEGTHALSFAQERLWFLQRFVPAPALYNVPLFLRLTGPLDLAALRRSLAALIADHRILRTRIVESDAGPGQVLLSPPPLVLEAEPLTETELVATLNDEAQRPFDLTREAPIRCRLLRLGAEDHVLAVTQHHLVTDGWALGLLLQRLSAGYAAALRGTPPPPAPRPDYLDMVPWQRAALRGATLADELAFWTARLRDTPLLELPLDRPRPPLQSHRGATLDFILDAASTAALDRLAAQLGATRFTLLLATFRLLLAEWSGQRDIAIGTPIANRTRLELEAMLGLFTNTLVLRQAIDPTRDFASLVQQETDGALAAYAHQALPFELLVEALKPPRDPSRNAVFQVFFILQNAPAAAPFAGGGLSTERLEADYGTAKFDLTLSFEEQSEGLRGVFEYATDLFDAASIRQLAARFAELLSLALSAPTRAISGTMPPRTAVAVPAAASRASTPPRAPSGRLEEAIAAIWCDILQRPAVEATASFFDLGGTSLGMMRLQTALLQRLGRDLPIVTLFAHPTVAGLAALLERPEDQAATAPGSDPLAAAAARAALRRGRRPGGGRPGGGRP